MRAHDGEEDELRGCDQLPVVVGTVLEHENVRKGGVPWIDIGEDENAERIRVRLADAEDLHVRRCEPTDEFDLILRKRVGEIGTVGVELLPKVLQRDRIQLNNANGDHPSSSTKPMITSSFTMRISSIEPPAVRPTMTRSPGLTDRQSGPVASTVPTRWVCPAAGRRTDSSR